MQGNSILHRADPRTKLLLTFFFLAAIFMTKSNFSYALLAIFAVTILLACKIPVKHTLIGVKPILIIFTLTAILNLLTEADFMATLSVMVRLVLMVVYASLIPITTTPIMLTDGLESLMKPLKLLKIPVSEIATMMSIALGFIPTLSAETKRIIDAQASRGADVAAGGIITRAKNFIPIMVPLFVSVVRRADELADAMDARCYRGGKGRTRMRKLRFGVADIKLIAVSLAVACINVVIIGRF